MQGVSAMGAKLVINGGALQTPESKGLSTRRSQGTNFTFIGELVVLQRATKKKRIQ
jgi:hypothetical protein